MIGLALSLSMLAAASSPAQAPSALRDLESWGEGAGFETEAIPIEWNLGRPRGGRGPEPVLGVHPPIRELSGALLDRSQSVLWTLGDGGTGPFLGRTPVSLKQGLTPSGETERIAVEGAENLDWEAMALGPEGALWIADCGDNKASRASVVLFRLDPAAVSEGRAPASRRIELRYPDGPRDAEAAVIVGTRLFLIEKTAWGLARVVWADISPEAEDRQTARAAGRIDLNVVTDASLAPGGRVHLLSYDGIYALDGWFDPARDPAGRTLQADRVAGVKDIVARNKEWWQFESLVALSDEEFLVGEEKGHFFPRKASRDSR